MDAETNVYVSENFTVMTDTMANDYLHGPEKENGGYPFDSQILRVGGAEMYRSG